MTNDKTLIRLKNWKNDDIIRCFYTNNGIDFLKQYYFLKENDMEIYIPDDFEHEKDPYKDKEAGMIEEIHTSFGGNGSLPCIDVYITVW